MQIGSNQKEKQGGFQIDCCNEFVFADCNFQCLTDCPAEAKGVLCYWDDPDYPILDKLPEFEVWRWDHEELVRKEPKNPMRTRCRRCFSTKVTIGYPYIKCRNCGYDESLIDFPISQDYHLALLQKEEGK